MTTEPIARARFAPLRWWHVAAVAEVEQQLFPADPWSAGQWWSELAGVPDRRSITVAWRPAADLDAPHPQDVLGYVDMAFAGDVADVQTVAVVESARRSGLGRQLLREGLDDARSRGCVRALLEVRAGNAAAIELYATEGFTSVDRRRGYYPDGDDALVMEARLA